MLRECLDWLQRLERGESVVVNLRPDADNLRLVPNDPHADKDSNKYDPQARHRHKLAEPPPKPKKLAFLGPVTSTTRHSALPLAGLILLIVALR